MVEQDDDLPQTFLDPTEEAASGRPKAHTCDDLKALHRWREEMSRKLISAPAYDVAGFGPSEMGGGHMKADAGGPSAEEVGGAASFIKRLTQVHADEVQDQLEDGRRRMEDEMRRPGTPLAAEGSGTMPLMICWPPPGIVPVEALEATFLPWTISPDPQRLVPTSLCAVRVYRVGIDVGLARAERQPGGEVALGSFCVDCSDVGTPFCVIFTLGINICAGDQFEVVLSGLGDKLQSGRVVSDLQYFVSFESFRPSLRDSTPLRHGASQLAAVLGTSHIWGEAIASFPSPEAQEMKHSVGVAASVVVAASMGRRGAATTPGLANLVSEIRAGAPPQLLEPESGASPRGSPDGRSPSRGKPSRARPAVAQRALQLPRLEGRARKYDARHPPPIGVVAHPGGTSNPSQGTYSVEVSEGNEVILGLVVPSCILVRAALSLNVQSQARWEVVPRSVAMSYFEEPEGQVNELSTLAEEAFDVLDAAAAVPARNLRVVVRLFLPCPGRFELHLYWGYLPRDLQYCGGFNSTPTPTQHPLVVNVNTSPAAQGIRALVSSMYLGAFRTYGYPLKHPLAEHFGVTLVSPMRYRLRAGYVRFAVYVHQEGAPPALACTLLQEALRMAGGLADAADDDGVPAVSAPPSEHGHESRRTTKDTIMHGGAGGHSGHASAAASEAEDEDGASTAVAPLAEVWERIQGQLAQQIRRGCVGSVCIAAILGPWRRVEMLERRLLAPQQAWAGEGELALPVGGGGMEGVEEVEPPRPEVHEAFVRLTEADAGLPVQLVIFQSGTLSAQRPSHGQAEVSVEAPPLGAAPTPVRWCLAEFLADDEQPMPFDEDEMAKPLPSPAAHAGRAGLPRSGAWKGQ